MAMALARAPSELGSLPATDFHLMARYWAEEPWGPYRDNLHAGLIASAVINASGRAKKEARPEQFLFQLRDRAASGNALIQALKMMATKRRRKT